ncbi:helix-turn-helix domain-containing protein [Megasphaera sp. An286]|uniref:helix-turn-helix domain-containing protein n=1 Tax=Megasphaera sp. An286 TaxID=1965622 RepID=UPI000B3BBB89|nr:helix-turn-helix domain-containing protein [Megasphaera sp. An286]OUO47989.1 excisionase [Megasphaera sp. An286]
MNGIISDDIITVDEMCEILMIGKNMAYRLLNSGEIRCFKISREWKIPRKSVYEYIQRQCSKKGDEDKVH